MRTEAVFIDALGTILWLEPPWERIDPAAVAGIPPQRVREAFLAEIAFYMPRSAEGKDTESLAGLRRRCAEVLSEELGREIAVETMVDALHFRAFDDAAPALAALRDRGLRLVCVSNWDCSLTGVLEEIGLAPYFDGVVTSAGAQARKPDPAIFAQALELSGCTPAAAFHVGDSADDIAAAEAAGIRALLLDRSGAAGIASLGEIVDHLAG